MKNVFNKKTLMIAAVSVFLLLFISMGTMLAILVSHVKPDYLGKIVDVIPLEPVEDEKSAFHLMGRVINTDGTYASGRTVVLRSDPNYTVSGYNANFFFGSVTPGSHTIYILEDGEPIAGCNIRFERRKDVEKLSVSQKSENEQCSITLPIDLRALEVTLMFDSENKTLTLVENKVTEISRSGIVRTLSGSADITLYAVVTPLVNIYLTDGTIIIPFFGTGVQPTVVIDPTERTVFIDSEAVLDDGTIITREYIQLPDGTRITKDGIVRKSNGDEYEIGDSGVQIINEGGKTQVIPIGKETEEKSELIITGKNKQGTFIRWQQNGEIDLFFNRTSGIDDDKKIAPGSAGYYLFKLDNTRSKALDIKITLSEKDIHLPLNITLTPLDDSGSKISGKSIKGKITDGILVLSDSIEAKKSTVYLLEWEWPFEGGNDEHDTQIGKEGGTYNLNLEIYASEK